MTQKTKTGLLRIIKATIYSWEGIKAAWKNESAFRQEFCLLVILLPAGLFLGRNNIERALLILPLIIVMITELLNSAIEAIVDFVSPEYHQMAKQAKDMGSAAVFFSLAAVIITWALILI